MTPDEMIRKFHLEPKKFNKMVKNSKNEKW